MRILVLMLYDIADKAAGRNLRLLNIIRLLGEAATVECLTSSKESADRTRAQLDTARVKVLCPEDAVEGHANPGAPAPPGRVAWRRVLRYFGYTADYMSAVYARASSFDSVLGFGVLSAPYLAALSETPSAPRTVCDLIDDPLLTWMHSHWGDRVGVHGLKYFLCIQYLRWRILRQIDELVAIAPRDAGTLSRAGAKRVRVVPNGVTVPRDSGELAEREPLVVFSGTMDFPPNERAAEYFATAVWPLVRRLHRESKSAIPEPRFAVVGANPTRRVRTLESIPGVTVTGKVPNVRDWLLRATVAVAPMVSGSGLKNKILEACAASCPVVATPLGVEGLPAGEENGLLYAGSPAKQAQLIHELLFDTAKARALGDRAREMVLREFAWETVVQAFQRIISHEAGGCVESSEA